MRRPVLFLLVPLALLATGCFKVNLDIEVEDDGSGRIEGEFAVNPDQYLEALGPLAEAFAEAGAEAGEELSRESLCASFLEDQDPLPPEVNAETFDEGGFCGQRFSAEFGPGDDVAATIGELFGDDGTDEDEIVLRKEGENWRFELPIDAEDLGTEGGDEFFPPEVLDELLGDSEFRVRVQLPGRPLEHNATSVDGNTFTWDLDITNPPQENLFAVTEPGSPGGGGSNAWLWVVLGLVAVAAVVGLVVFLRRRGPGGPTPSPAAAPGATAASPADTTPVPGTAPQPPQPRWDPERNAWVVEDPTRGLLIHDQESGEWRPA